MVVLDCGISKSIYTQTEMSADAYLELPRKPQLYSYCPTLPFLSYIPLFDDGKKIDAGIFVRRQLSLYN